jgi:hypothetical protein
MVTYYHQWPFLGHLFGTINATPKVNVKHWADYRPLKGVVEH